MEQKRSVLCLVLALIIVVAFSMVDAASRQPNFRDHTHCKMEYHEQWEDVMQTADPYAVVESYYVSGQRENSDFDDGQCNAMQAGRRQLLPFRQCLQTLTLTLKVAANSVSQ